MFNQDLNPGQSVVVTAHAVVAATGNPGLASGFVWSGDGELGVIAAPDGLSAIVSVPSATSPGVHTVSVAGVKPSGATITGSFTITVLAQPADGFEFTFGIPS